MEYVMLKDVCAINMGQSPDSNSYNENGKGIPFFQGNADFGERYPVVRKWCSSPTKIAMPEDILISVRAPIGALNYAKEKCCIGRGLAAITPDRLKVAPEFIFWFLKSKNTELNSKGTGSTFKAIGRKALEETMVPDIPVDKQLECATTLNKIYAVIQMRKQELLALDDLIRARFVEMFGTGNYPIEKLGAVCKKITDGTHKTPTYLNEGITFISAKNIVNGELDFTDIKYISEIEYQEIQKRCQTAIYDILLSKSGSLGSPVIVKTEKKLGLFESLAILKYDRKKLVPEFLCEQLKTDRIQRQFTTGTKGVAIKHLHLGVIADTDIIVPPLDEQKQFADFVHQVNKSKVEVQKSLDETQKLFDSLMQQYFG